MSGIDQERKRPAANTKIKIIKMIPRDSENDVGVTALSPLQDRNGVKTGVFSQTFWWASLVWEQYYKADNFLLLEWVVGGRFQGTCLGTFWVMLSVSNSTVETQSCSSLRLWISVGAPSCHGTRLKNKLNIFYRSQMGSSKTFITTMKYTIKLTQTFPVPLQALLRAAGQLINYRYLEFHLPDYIADALIISVYS